MISDLLKEHTKTLHDLVEEKLLSKKIMDRSFDLNDYRYIITHNYNFLKHFEGEVFSKFSPETAKKLQLNKRRKLDFIEKDISLLEIEISDKKFPILIKMEAEAFGILYVMEGATLGGNIIAKNLSKNSNFSKITFNYFGCYGDQTGFLWKLFKEVLEEKAISSQHEDFIKGAKIAYQFLLDH